MGMSIAEIIDKTLYSLKSLAAVYLFILIVSIAVLIVLGIKTRKIDIDRKSFGFISIFFEMKTSDAIFFACAWIRLLMIIGLMFSFRKLTVFDYFAFLLPSIVYCLQFDRILSVPSMLGWTVIQFMGLVASNIVCGFYLEMDRRFIILLTYIIMCLFMSAFSVYRFVNEISDISNRRTSVAKME